MKFKGTAGMMVVFLSLGIYYFLVDLPTEKKKAQEKEIAGKVLYFKIADIEEFSAKFTTKIHDVKGVCCEGRFADTLRAHPGNSAYVSGQLPRGGSGDCSEATHDEYRPLGDTAHIAVHVRLGFGIRLGKVQGAHLAGEGPRSCCGGRGTGCRPGRAG